jgi:hypothetical protein
MHWVYSTFLCCCIAVNINLFFITFYPSTFRSPKSSVLSVSSSNCSFVQFLISPMRTAYLGCFILLNLKSVTCEVLISWHFQCWISVFGSWEQCLGVAVSSLCLSPHLKLPHQCWHLLAMGIPCHMIDSSALPTPAICSHDATFPFPVWLLEFLLTLEVGEMTFGISYICYWCISSEDTSARNQ